MARTDLPRLKRAIADLNEYYEGTGIGFFMPSENEDYGIDIPMSGVTDKGYVIRKGVELKAINNKRGHLFDGKFYKTKACRNSKCRYGLTGNTNASQESVENDRTPMPNWCYSNAPLHVLNANTLDGKYEKSKMDTLRRYGAAVVFMFCDGYLIFSLKDLEEAIVGYAWIYVTHTEEELDENYSDEPRWELKAVIDMNKYTRWIKKEVPAYLLQNRTRKS